jgi:hypothetical protein
MLRRVTSVTLLGTGAAKLGRMSVQAAMNRQLSRLLSGVLRSGSPRRGFAKCSQAIRHGNICNAGVAVCNHPTEELGLWFATT